MSILTGHPGHVAPGSFTLSDQARPKWGWFVALGVLLLILGMLAFSNEMLATFVSVAYVGVLMLLGAVAQIIHAFQVRKWSSFAIWLLSGLLYGAAGILTFVNPVLAAGALTLALAVAMIVAGAMRIGVGVRLRPPPGWGWLVASGVVTLAVGVIIAFGWPGNSLWLLGIFLAIDLTWQGAMALSFGLALRAGTRAVSA
jgi:uncharacterized membrane protein HdeD (DUF308 family)